MAGSTTLIPWLPALLIAGLALLGAAAAALPAKGAAGKRVRIAAIGLCGAAALATSLWQARAAAVETARLKQNDRTAQLTVEVKALEQQLVQLKESARVRSLGDQTAGKLTDYLRSFGRHKIVVSCAPDDFEAYRYATELANTLKAAGWEARGPETTAIFGNIRSMAINIYDLGSAAADTTKILVDAFQKFGVPYRTRVPPSGALDVDGALVELFVAAKPASSATAER